MYAEAYHFWRSDAEAADGTLTASLADEEVAPNSKSHKSWMLSYSLSSVSIPMRTQRNETTTQQQLN
jgi:hypothetical protein